MRRPGLCIQAAPNGKAPDRQGSKTLGIKTTDIRLSTPGARIGAALLGVTVASTGLVAAPMVGLLDATERNKAASAVFCVPIDGRDFLGNDGRLFAFGSEGELRASLADAISKLRQNIQAGSTGTSPACEPGWEGGQPR